jgi:hypothetical protein
LEWILLLEIQNKLQNLGLEGKISCTLNFSHIVKLNKNSTLKMWKIKNVFTLGPMVHATLVQIKVQVYLFFTHDHGINYKPLKPHESPCSTYGNIEKSSMK